MPKAETFLIELSFLAHGIVILVILMDSYLMLRPIEVTSENLGYKIYTFFELILLLFKFYLKEFEIREVQYHLHNEFPFNFLFFLNFLDEIIK